MGLTQFDGHTPGPWAITENSAHGKDEAWCYWHQVGPVALMGEKATANSRLIAAAPDLLAECKRLSEEKAALVAALDEAAQRHDRVRGPRSRMR